MNDKNFNWDEVEGDGLAPEIDDGGVSRLTKLAQEQLDKEDEIKDIEGNLSERKKELNELSCVKIPDLMFDLEVDKIKLSSGKSITIKDNTSASIKEENKEEAFLWLDEHGHSDLIKHTITLNFTKGKEEEVKALLKQLKELGHTPSDKQAVHAGTLKSFVKEQIADGVNIPRDLFSIFEGKKTIIK